MAQNKEVREVFEEAVAIGAAVEKEKSRHSNATARLMVRAAENVYAAHLVEAITPDGYVPVNGGAAGREEVEATARQGRSLSAKGYALLIGFSEAYISRLYRLGFGLAAGVLDPAEEPEPGEKTRWQMVSREVGDSPEIARVLGKDAKEFPTVEALDEAIEAAKVRRAKEREHRAAEKEAAADENTWVPRTPSEQISRLHDLAEALTEGRKLTPRQIERVRVVMDSLRDLIESWIEEHGDGHVPMRRKSA